MYVLKGLIRTHCWFYFQWFNDYGLNVYEYLLTLKSSYAAEVYPSWYGVPHGDDIQVNVSGFYFGIF